jgi:hypothetical protein
MVYYGIVAPSASDYDRIEALPVWFLDQLVEKNVRARNQL